VVIQGSVPAAVAPPVGVAAARASIPTAIHVDDRNWRRGRLDVQNRLSKLMAFHPLVTIFIRYCELAAYLRRNCPNFLRTTSTLK
jgi:hypothetical protein